MKAARGIIAAIAASLALPLWAAQPICRAQIQYVQPPLNACLGTDRIKIAAVGDVLLHRPLQRRGYEDDQGFFSLWSQVAPVFQAADIAYANLEGPVAPGTTRSGKDTADPGPTFDDRVYSSFPMFNYHPTVVSGLQRAGINLVSTANNHAMDRGVLGADRTIDALRAANLTFTGTIKSDARRTFTAYAPTHMGRVAWIACSYSTNGLADPNAQVLMCFEDREELLDLVTKAAMLTDVAAVIVAPHWGAEYSHSPNARQKTLAADLIQAGASAVIGTHPHVVQPWESLPRNDGTQGLAIYSTGNFVSGQVSLPRRVGALAWIELCRPKPPADLANALKSQLVVANSGWLPLLMTRTPAGPELQIVGPRPTGLGLNAANLLKRHLPENGIRANVSCVAPEATLLALQ